MKRILLVLFIITSVYRLDAQINQKDFDHLYNQLIDNLVAEKWDTSDSLTTVLLTKIDKIDSLNYAKQVLMYISIYSTAGLLNENKINRETALNKVLKYKGLRLILPAHPLNSECYVNCTHLDSEQENTFFTSVNNNAGTLIFSFEYVKMKEPINIKYIKKIEGKNISLSGILEEIAVEGNMFPRFKIICNEGEMEVLD